MVLVRLVEWVFESKAQAVPATKSLVLGPYIHCHTKTADIAYRQKGNNRVVETAFTTISFFQQFVPKRCGRVDKSIGNAYGVDNVG